MAFRIKELMVDLAHEELGIAGRPVEASGCTGSSCRAAATKDGGRDGAWMDAAVGQGELGRLREQLRQTLAEAAV